MYIVVINYEQNNDILLFDNYDEAYNKYIIIKKSGQLVYLTEVLKK